MVKKSYTQLASELRLLPTPNSATGTEALVQAATLAASSHNTQPWLFRIEDNGISLAPDFSRTCPAVDPDNSHLFKSLGCAVENLVTAAPVYGFTPHAHIEKDGKILITLEQSDPSNDDSMLQVIGARQCTKTPYDGKPISVIDCNALEAAGKGAGVWTLLINDTVMRERVLEYVNEGNKSQLGDPDFRRELIHWIRFNDGSAMATGDGLGGRPNGQPQLPTWLAKPLMSVVLTANSQIKKDTENLRSSAGIAVFIGEKDDIPTWIEIGRAYERFALVATRLGIRNAFINQPIEVRSLRPQLHGALGLKPSETAHLMVRYGYGATAPYSLRRSVAEVQIS